MIEPNTASWRFPSRAILRFPVLSLPFPVLSSAFPVLPLPAILGDSLCFPVLLWRFPVPSWWDPVLSLVPLSYGIQHAKLRPCRAFLVDGVRITEPDYRDDGTTRRKEARFLARAWRAEIKANGFFVFRCLVSGKWNVGYGVQCKKAKWRNELYVYAKKQDGSFWPASHS
jgi:hypothetical protein